MILSSPREPVALRIQHGKSGYVMEVVDSCPVVNRLLDLYSTPAIISDLHTRTRENAKTGIAKLELPAEQPSSFALPLSLQEDKYPSVQPVWLQMRTGTTVEHGRMPRTDGNLGARTDHCL
ncbi:hypothetical protein HOY82DRAFT_608134 [Tuber indicum]|nr:hypothetical protein HOY82DRAFT_608134 [Tuber indicum]